MAPHTNNSLDFDVPLLASATDQSSSFQIVGEATYKGIGGQALTRVLRTDPILVRFRSGFRVTSEARYFSDEGIQYGSGPIPPVAGSSTIYRVLFRLEKQAHELSDVMCRATLAPNVVWKGNTTVGAGTLEVDEKTQVLRWKVNRMPDSVKDLEADADIEVTPNAKDVGRFASLLSVMECSGKDQVTTEQMTITAGALTTDLPNDPQAKRSGVVKK